VIASTINGVQASLAIDNPFPDHLERDTIIKKIMRATVKDLIEEYGTQYKDIYVRLKNDTNYTSLLAGPVISPTFSCHELILSQAHERVALYRGYLKEACVTTVPTAYRLHGATREFIEALTRDNLFIFPMEQVCLPPLLFPPF
jgi:hypothetical protein